MTEQTLETGIEIFARLINQEAVKYQGEHTKLYEAYTQNGDIFDTVNKITKALNLEIYDYRGGLYLTPGESNHVFGYTNEELKEMIGLRLNRELFLCYFIIYHIITKFYTDSATYTYQEYVKVSEIVEAVDASFQGLAEKVETLALTEVEEYSFEQMALAWDLPLLTNEDSSVIRAEKGSRAGMVKKTFQFLIRQGLFLEVEDRYYPTDRFSALIESYFESEQSRIYEIMTGGRDDAAY